MSYRVHRTARFLSAGASALALSLAATPALAATAEEAAAPEAPIPAAEAADEAAGGSYDIVVTAGRREERLQDVPTAVSALSKEQFQVGGIGRSANEVLSLVPNASAGTQQHGRPRWWIRGVGAGQQQLDLANPVGFYLDDVYISNSSATGLPLFDIERVEILRGPQGTLWGKNTTGGAINVISKRPSLSGDDENYLKLEYGSYDDKIAEGGVGAVIVPDKLAVRGSFRIDDRDGRFTNLFTGQNSNAISDQVFRGQILAKPTDDLEALLSLHYRRYKTDGSYWNTASYAASGVYRGGYVPSTDQDTTNTNAPEWTNNKQVGGSLHLDWHPGDLTLTSITGYERFDSRSAGDNDYTPFEISRGYSNASSRQWSQELRLTSPKDQTLSWIVGAFYFNEKIRSNAYSAALPETAVPALAGGGATVAFSNTRYNHKTESGAVFASGTLNISDRFKLTLGGRWTRETKQLEFNRLASASAATASWSNYAQWWNSYTGTYGGAGTFSGNLSRTWDAFTYDATPSFQIDRHNLIYFKYSHGLKSGGFNTAATLPAALIAVEPERLNSYEVGYKSQWLDGAVTLNLTGFHYDYRNVQVNVVGPNPGAVGGTTVSYLQNAAKGHVDGAEVELAVRPVENLHLNAALGLLNTRYDQFNVLNGGANLSGAQFVRSPHTTLNVAASYTVPLRNSGNIEFEADARYTSLQYYYVTPQDPATRYYTSQPGYTLANARITYTTADDKFSVSAFVNNLLNARYLNHSLVAASATVTGDVVQWGDPRTWGASVIYRF
ncbi:TonB-dependent receptor [Novosphingobium flavum]|uniref:TonB-dependent receptor n=1 Tax=Novosphingobium flavum TaxID=1778672 RepID=UPI001FE802D9|nr:TonB-dependent receptor [Novosphingobium flavum]